MPATRNLVTPISIAVAVVSVAWAIYATQHKDSPDDGPAGPGAGGRGGAPAFVSIAPVRSERVSQKLEALGNARANESVDVSSKTSNVVTAVMFRDGERVRRGQVLVQLDDAQARADVAAAQAAGAEARGRRGVVPSGVCSARGRVGREADGQPRRVPLRNGWLVDGL